MRIPLAIFALAAALSTDLFAAEKSWQPVSGHIMSRWAKEVTPETVLKEYPRPQMVRSNWVNLNGLWDYAITEKGSDVPANFDGKVLVPFAIESALSGVGKALTPDQQLIYHR